MKDESIEQMKTLIIAEEKKVAVEKEPSDPSENLSCSRVGSLVVQSLGDIEQNVDGFHDEKYIMPKGYCATRIFWSGRIPKSRTVYICKIELNGDSFGLDAVAITNNDIEGRGIFALLGNLVDKREVQFFVID